MIYFRKKVISYSPGVAQKIMESLKNRTANKYGFLDVVSTATWVIFPERKFVGINLKNGGIKLARYRSPIFSFLPKVIAKITSETQGDGSILKMRFRFGLLSFLLILFFLMSPIGVFIQLLLGKNNIDFSSLILNGLGILLIGGLAVIESKSLEKKILETEKIEQIGEK